MTDRFPGLGKVGGVPIREPYPGEREFFQKNPHVAGMAGEDNQVMLNPYSQLSPQELQQVLINEAARVRMRQVPPQFDLTPEQQQTIASTSYATAPPQAQRDTILARLLSGDPSGGQATQQQSALAKVLRESMFQGPKR